MILAAQDVQIPKHSERYHKLIPLLHKNQKYSELLFHASNMVEMYTKDTFPLEWICKIYSEVDELKTNEVLIHDISHYINLLLEMNPKSSIGLLAKAVKLFRENEFEESRDILLHGKIQDSLVFFLHKFF